MIKRSITILGVVCALAISAVVAAAPPPAPEQTHYTFVSLWAVPRAQWPEFEKAQEHTYPLFERLVGDGTLIAWGSEAAVVHNESGFTHSDWFVSNTQAGITKTLEALRSSSRTQALANTTKHADLMLHTIAHGGKTARTTSGYLRVAFWQAKPSRGNDVEEFFNKYIQPDLDAGGADGSVLMYNFDSEQIHTDAPGGYNIAVVYANADGWDKAAEILSGPAKANPRASRGYRAMQENPPRRHQRVGT